MKFFFFLRCYHCQRDRDDARKSLGKFDHSDWYARCRDGTRNVVHVNSLQANNATRKKLEKDENKRVEITSDDIYAG